jgi:SAM-dependent methyltransferase/glycosyltransferase involved in cell wall biosynthesis
VLEWTGERYVPWLEEAAIGYEHLHRYAYATHFVRGKRVLDLACGEGYGSYLLAKTAASVVGIDIDEPAIKHARNKYIKQNLEFKVGSITNVAITGTGLFDVVVCFEALEHVEEHQALLSEAKRLLTSDGIFLISTPNKIIYTDEPQYSNPFHVHELYFDEFKELLGKYFKIVKFLGQRIYCNSNIWPVFSGGGNKIVKYLIDRHAKEFVFVEDDKRIPVYFIAIASDADRDIEEAESALIDVSNTMLKEKDGQIAAYVTQQEHFLRDIAQLSNTVQAQQQALAGKDQQVAQVMSDHQRLSREVVELQLAVQAQQQALAGKDQQLQLAVQAQQQALAGKDQQVTQLISEHQRLSQEASQVRDFLQTREEYISAIENSVAWALLVKFRRLRDKICPDGTRRRQIYNFIKNFCKNFPQGRSPAPQPNSTDPGLPARIDQNRSLYDESQRSAAQILPVKLISQRPDELVLAKLSVVIPTRNGMSEGFDSALRAISRQRGIAEIEVAVVDSGSSDGTVDAAKSYGAKVFPIRPEDFNHGATRNYGADQTTGDLIMFTVQDAIPASEDLFYEMAKALLRDPKLAGVSVRQLPRSDADLYACWERWNHNRFHLESPQDQLLQVAGLDNVCSMVKRSVWEKFRFPTTHYAEDLEFGLACFRQGYRIAWLSERATIHSHNRSPFYNMSRHYADRRVMIDLLKEPFPPWVETVTVDQLFSGVKASYLALNEFVSSIDKSGRHEPRYVLNESLTRLSLWRALADNTNGRGEPSLDNFFATFDGCFEKDFPGNNPCILEYEGTINSILEFIGDRYQTLACLELNSLMYKAFAAVAGSAFGNFYFSGNRKGQLSNSAKQLGDLLAVGYRK